MAGNGNNVVEEVTGLGGSAPQITTVAGVQTLVPPSYSGEGGSAISAYLNPVGVAVNAAGTVLYVSDECNNAVREVQLAATPADGTIFTLVSSMDSPTGLALDPAGDLFIAESGHNQIDFIDHVTGQMSVLAGTGASGNGGDGGPAADAQLYWPTGLAVDPSGNLYVTNNIDATVREITGLVSTAVGNGSYGNGGDTGPAIDAQLANPNGVAVDAAGDIFIADTWNNSVREVNAATGAITTIAGGGTETDPEFSGLATDAQLNNPQGVAVFGNTLYIADSGNNVVRAVDLTTDTITTVAGDRTAGYAVNCTPTSAELDWPIELATDSSGNLFIADNVVDEVTGLVNGTPNIITVAGVQTLDPPSYSGDGGTATSTYLNPVGVAVNSAGTVLYVSDDSNGGVRKVDLATGIISTVASDMWAPTDLELDPAGNLFIADSGDGYIQEVVASTGEMTAVAGSGSWGYSGDGGPALNAKMFWPTGLAIDTSGDLFMTDNWNAVIREVGSVAAVSPTISLISSAEGATVGQKCDIHGHGQSALSGRQSDGRHRRFRRWNDCPCHGAGRLRRGDVHDNDSACPRHARDDRRLQRRPVPRGQHVRRNGPEH